MVTLLGEEHWRYRVTTTDAQGHAHTETRTGREDLPRVPVMAYGPLQLVAGDTHASASSCRCRRWARQHWKPRWPGSRGRRRPGWTFPWRLDSSIEVPVRILQPTALLRAGVVHVGEFALYEAADAQAGGVARSITRDPVPLVPGHPFRGRLVLRPDARCACRDSASSCA